VELWAVVKCQENTCRDAQAAAVTGRISSALQRQCVRGNPVLGSLSSLCGWYGACCCHGNKYHLTVTVFLSCSHMQSAYKHIYINSGFIFTVATGSVCLLSP